MKPNWLRLDRGFYSVVVIRYRQMARYRQLDDACIKTSTRNPNLRLLFVGIALQLNVWVWVHWVYLASSRRGSRQLNRHKLRFKTLLM